MRNKPVDRSRLATRFRAGLSYQELAEEFECGLAAIRRNLKIVGAIAAVRRGPRKPSLGKKMLADPELREDLRVDRDPCTYCGVRADIGCRHNMKLAARNNNEPVDSGDKYPQVGPPKYLFSVLEDSSRLEA